MPVELKIPEVGESVTEVFVGHWRKGVGESVERDENVVELETDKATFELPAPAQGRITQILKQAGDSAAVGEVIGYIDNLAPVEGATAAPAPTTPRSQAEPSTIAPHGATDGSRGESRANPTLEKSLRSMTDSKIPAETSLVTTGRSPESARQPLSGDERVVPMSPIRRRIAQRLVEAQQTAALLTTFNEIDMSAVIELRKRYRDRFQEAYGVKLGFMSFFVKAVVEALAQVPQVGAEVRGNDIVYRQHADIGIAVGSGKGLVVPILRQADSLSFAEIEKAIADFSRRAAENQLKLEELQGGTFTISNGGIYGSLLSTPIVNPPQSGILGMHAIQERPVAREGQVVIRPMMYIALTYDHRVVDGREAVTFLNRIREIVEEPTRLLIEI